MKKYILGGLALAACVAVLFFLGQRLVENTVPAAEDSDAAPAVTAMASDGQHPQLIAHAGGAIYGYRLTNSLEALDEAYRNGFRFIEVDFERTTDGQIVLLHDWDGIAQRLLGSAGQRSLEEFTAAEPIAGLTLLTLEQLLAWMSQHPDCTIITDTKQEDSLGLLRDLQAQAGDRADAFLPQAYSYEEFQSIRDLGFQRIILTTYKMETDGYALAEFAQNNQPWAVTIAQELLEQEGFLTALAQTGTAVYAHTVNTVDVFDQWRDAGLTGIYTDYFAPAHWVY